MRLKPLMVVALFAIVVAVRPATAGPALLFDASDGKVLYAEEMDDQWHPASLTKIMTAYMAFKAIKDGKLHLDDKVICSDLANQQPPSKIGLPVGGEMTVELALQALIIKSANDVAVMLAEKISGNELQFVADMNATARDLGMTRTTFANPNGLPAFNQVTTARDLAKLARAVSAEFPQYAPYWAMTQMRIGKIRLASHNGLLKTFEGADGLKTGFICDSGFNVVASATRDGRRLETFGPQACLSMASSNWDGSNSSTRRPSTTSRSLPMLAARSASARQSNPGTVAMAVATPPSRPVASASRRLRPSAKRPSKPPSMKRPKPVLAKNPLQLGHRRRKSRPPLAHRKPPRPPNRRRRVPHLFRPLKIKYLKTIRFFYSLIAFCRRSADWRRFC
jgi:hypothetical protein